MDWTCKCRTLSNVVSSGLGVAGQCSTYLMHCPFKRNHYSSWDDTAAAVDPTWSNSLVLLTRWKVDWWGFELVCYGRYGHENSASLAGLLCDDEFSQSRERPFPPTGNDPCLRMLLLRLQVLFQMSTAGWPCPLCQFDMVWCRCFFGSMMWFSHGKKARLVRFGSLDFTINNFKGALYRS